MLRISNSLLKLVESSECKKKLSGRARYRCSRVYKKVGASIVLFSLFWPVLLVKGNISACEDTSPGGSPQFVSAQTT